MIPNTHNQSNTGYIPPHQYNSPSQPPSQQSNGQYNNHNQQTIPSHQYNTQTQYSSPQQPAYPPQSQYTSPNQYSAPAPSLPYAPPPVGPPSPHRYTSSTSQYSNGQYNNMQPSGPYPSGPLSSLHQSQTSAYNQQPQQQIEQQMNSMSLNNNQQYSSQQPQYPLPPKSGPLPPSASQYNQSQLSAPYSSPQQAYTGTPQQPYQSQQGQYASQQQYPAFPIAPHWVVPVHPKYFSVTCAGIPANQQLRVSTCIPIGGIIRPINDDIGTNNTQLPIAVYGQESVVRCKDCRSYMNPYVQFLSNGHQWRCNVCGLINDTPPSYYSPLDSEGKRVDTAQRVELTYAAHEIQVPADYMVRQPMPPLFYFVIDVSKQAQLNGYLHVVCDTILKSLSQLPGDKRTMIGFMTYDSTVHYYTFNSAHEQPQMYVVSDLDDPFIPTPHDTVSNLDECRTQIESFLQSLPTMFVSTNDVESCVGSAVQCATMSISRIGGQLSLFICNLPSIGTARLQNRENKSLTNTDKEHTLMSPATDFYKKFPNILVKSQIQCNIYFISTNNSYIDIGTVGEVARFSGGEIYYYPSYNNSQSGSKLQHELHRSLIREQTWESVVRVRASKGVVIYNFHGNFYLRNNDLLAAPCVDSDKTYSFELRSESDSILSTQSIIVQSAVLYTSSQGERRVRVQTLCLPVLRTAAELFNSININGCMNLVCKESVQLCWQQGFEKARQFIQSQCISILRSYQQNVRPQDTNTNVSQMLQVLPIMSLGLLKSQAFVAGFDIPTDVRAYSLMRLCTMSIVDTETYVRPRLLRVDHTTLVDNIGIPVVDNTIIVPTNDMSIKSYDTFIDLPINFIVSLPGELPLNSTSVTDDSILLIDNGMEIIVRIGHSVPSDTLYQLFGIGSIDQLDSLHPSWQQVQLNDTQSINARFHNIIAQLRNTAISGQYQSITVVKQGEPNVMRFINCLIEDRQAGASNYGLNDLMNMIYTQRR